MDNAKSNATEGGLKPGGIGGDVTRLKSDASATVAELRQFLGNMRNRSPQEVLGLVATSGLARSVLLATVLIAGLLVALTAVPYYYQGSEAAEPKKPSGQTAAAAQAPAESSPAEPASPAATTAGGSPTDPDRAVDAMGIGETRSSDPKQNPRETDLDNLLDGIE
ncbi:MAG: hypothetical protein HQ581_18805 [Planctomycetes bacterium]|nr:hypothetical protein [Planctomycetota bacterium]